VPALKPLIDVLGNRSQDVRCAAAHALAVIGPGATEATPKLIRLLSTNSPDLTRCVLDALGHIGSPEALRALRAELKVEAFQGETLNALALMHRRASSAAHDVLPLLDDPKVADIAARTIGEIAIPSRDVVGASRE
jgi:HEAT repeat protein